MPEGYHPQETICFSPWAADSTTLAIMVHLLEGRIVEPNHFAFLDVCAVAQYLLLMEDYLTPHLLPYMSDEDTCNNPATLKGIELLYVTGYWSLAKHLYIWHAAISCHRLCRPPTSRFWICFARRFMPQFRHKKIHYKSLKKQQQQIQDILLHAVVLHNIALIVLLILIA